MSPAQKFFPTYFRPRNQYEIASGLCSMLVVLCPLIEAYSGVGKTCLH